MKLEQTSVRKIYISIEYISTKLGLKSLKKGFFLKLWKKGKSAHLTKSEVNELIQFSQAGKFDEGLKLIQRINRKNLDIDGRAIAFAFKNYLQFFKGKIRESDLVLILEELNKLEKQVKTLRGQILVKCMYATVCGYIKLEKKELKSFKEQMEKIDKSQTSIDSYVRDWVLMSINVALGAVYVNNGDYDSALNCFSEASSLNNNYNWILRQISSEALAGISYFLQDEVELAIVKYLESIKLSKKIGYTRGLLTSESNLIECILVKGDFQKAIKLAKISYNKAQEAKIPSLVGYSLFYIVQSLLELGLDDQIQIYLDELEELATTFPNNNIVDYSYQYSKALVLKSSKSFADRINAQTIFTHLLTTDDPAPVFDPKIGFHLAELTLKELQTTNNEELLVEFEHKVELLKEKALLYKSHSMLVETYLLESKLALIQTNLKEAQQKLNQALKLAREKNLHRMVFKVSKAYDTFLEEKKNWESLITNNAPMKEKLDKAQLDTLIDQAIHRKLEIEEVPEESVYLFIISDSGLTVYSYDFQEDKVIDDQLVGGFLSAVNTFCQEMFSTKGYLERVKYQDYTILLEPIGESFIVSYVLKGESYLASKRLLKLTNKITESPIYADFEEIKTTGLVKLDYDTMKDMIIEIF